LGGAFSFIVNTYHLINHIIDVIEKAQRKREKELKNVKNVKEVKRHIGDNDVKLYTFQ